MTASRSSMASVKAGAKALALVMIVFSVITYFISLAIGPMLYFSTSDGLTASAQPVHGFFLGLFMLIDIRVPLGTSMGVLFIAIWMFFLLAMVLAWLDRDGFLRSVNGAMSKSISLAKTNFLFIMPLVASALFSATIILSSFQEAQGVQTGSINFPTTNPYVILTSLSFAPLTEEFAFRITSIGILVGVLLLVVYRHDPKTSGLKNKAKLVLLAMFSPELAKAKMGYRNIQANGFPSGISPVEWTLILLTSAVFGLAHFLAGSGWEVGKVSTAFLAGFVFAIMYVSYGAYASVLLHWFFNYYFTVLGMAESAYTRIIPAVSTLVYLANFYVGPVIMLVFLLYSAIRLGRYLATRVSGGTAGPVSAT